VFGGPAADVSRNEVKVMNAAIYISDPSILGSRLFDRIEGIETYEGLGSAEGATGLLFKLTWGRVRMNFMPPGPPSGPSLAEHLNGFEGYARGVIKNPKTLAYTLGRIGMVRMCLGCIIEHAESDTNAVHDFLFEFNGHVNGLLFLDDTIYDFSGDALAEGGPAVPWGATSAENDDEREENPQRDTPAISHEAVEVELVELAGTWDSNIGWIYEIVETPHGFTWRASCDHGLITVTGNTLEASWHGSGGAGAAHGQITRVDSSGHPAEIEWDNTVVFRRRVSTGHEAAEVELVELEGVWDSNIGLVYEIVKTPHGFTWRSSCDHGLITVTSDTLEASWHGSGDAGAAQGQITRVDSSGHPLEIEWDNTVVFQRRAS
jgi:hypothetical protein